MNRKIIKSGPATLAISLPSKWAKKFNLEKGQELFVEEQGGSLRIKTTNPMEEDSAVINTTELSPFSTKIIGTLYRAGYKKIKAFYTPNNIVKHRGKDQKELDMIKETFDHLIGMQLWDLGKEDKGNFTTVRESAKVNPNEFDNITNKLYLHLSHQAEQTYEALKNNKDVFDEAYHTERLINQAQDFCIRILVLYGHEEYKKTLHFSSLIYNLENIGDRFFKIILSNKEKKEKPDQIVLDTLKEIVEIINETASIYRKFNFDKIMNLTKQLDKIKKQYESKIKTKEIKNSIISFNLHSIILELNAVLENLFLLNYEFFKE